MNKLLKENNIVIFQDGEIELKVPLDNDTIWLTQKNISELFEVTVSNISMHIKAIYKEQELTKEPTVKKYLTVQKEGNREVSRNVEHYNLDMIISVGYRVKSQKGVKFRQWATQVLKQYIFNGYVINSDKITHERFKELENSVHTLQNRLELLEDKTIKPSQGIFYNGEIFDAYKFISDLIKSSKKEIVLIDNYIDEKVLTLFSKYPKLQCKIITKSILKQLKLDIDKYNSQYNNLIIQTSNKFHDRFLILDNKEAYHIGASLKDLGKKVFAFNKIDIDLLSNIINI